MEGSASEAVFDAYNVNPQRFINEILNSIDDILDGAFNFSLEQALEITGCVGDSTSERSEELARGVSSLRQLTQAVLDKRMEMWEKYCLRHCFSVPEGFVLPKAQVSSSDGLLLQEGLIDEELDSQLDSLRNKLATVGKKSVELRKEILSLEKKFILDRSHHSYVVETLQLFEQNSVQKTFQEIREIASKLRSRIGEVKFKRKGYSECAWIGDTNSPSKKQQLLRDLDLSTGLEDLQEAADILRSARSSA